MLRAYSPELTGWFDDFGHSGFPDAFGGIGRISTTSEPIQRRPHSAGVPCTVSANPSLLQIRCPAASARR